MSNYDGIGCEKCGGCYCRCPPEVDTTPIYTAADLAAAVEGERERCAQIAVAAGCSDGLDCKNELMGREHYTWCPMSVAAAIRTQGDPPVKSEVEAE